ncbi:Leu/Phe/Val dehydrogenase [Dethiobacter alkaliphilus]|nr:Glu/Leu/Phe/Val dehydrogenase dimerization domain-containing protein [Dethiobacter alkaliphilus]
MVCFADMERFGMEEFVFCRDSETGLQAIVAIHDTTLGPALGGTRMKVYATEKEALLDVASLARAMTYKAAMAGLDLGGGKAVIIGDPEKEKTESLLRAYGRFVERLGGRYITSVDSGINQYDIDCIRRETKYAVGGSAVGGRGGCPSPATAYGVLEGIRACATQVYGSPELKGKVVAVQGVGNVGRALCQYLADEGAKLIISDVNKALGQEIMNRFGARWVEPDEVHKVTCDIFSPCALGNVVTEETLPEFDCRIIAGAANNVLADNSLADRLHESEILYAPDYVINAGGLIYVANENTSCTSPEIMAVVGRIGERLAQVLARANREDSSPLWVADKMAEERVQSVKGLLSLRSSF